MTVKTVWVSFCGEENILHWIVVVVVYNLVTTLKTLKWYSLKR